MIVQTRSRALRLIRQHDHALASGGLAHEWTGLDRGGDRAPLSLDAVLAVALHDFAWSRTDRLPRLDPDTGSALGFEEHPKEERVAFYSAGLDEAERIHPYSALLGSLHYGGFVAARAYPAFTAGERARQARLRGELSLGPEADARIESDRLHLRLFDNLSLFVCLTNPSSRKPPAWLAPERVGVTPDGERIRLRWKDDGILLVDPFPFRAPVELRVPCRDLPATRFESEEDLRAAWKTAPATAHRVTLCPAG